MRTEISCVVLQGQNQDALRSTLWRPARSGNRSVFRQTSCSFGNIDRSTVSNRSRVRIPPHLNDICERSFEGRDARWISVDAIIQSKITTCLSTASKSNLDLRRKMTQAFTLCPWRRRAESQFSQASAHFSPIGFCRARSRSRQTISVHE